MTVKENPSCFTFPSRNNLSLPTGYSVSRYFVLYWQEHKWYLTIQPIKRTTGMIRSLDCPTFSCNGIAALLLISSHILGSVTARTHRCNKSHFVYSCRTLISAWFTCTPMLSIFYYEYNADSHLETRVGKKPGHEKMTNISDMITSISQYTFYSFLQRGKRAFWPFTK